MKQIRAIVIDDSAFMRKIISDILASDPRVNVIATGRNGEDGIKKIQKLQPDVVTLDVHMPIMDGIKALSIIMKEQPTPVVMLSSETKEGTTKAIQAISNGAVDFIAKPSGSISLDIRKIQQEIISKVITASQVKLHKKPLRKAADYHIKTPVPKNFDKTIITIGTSTGGPRALQQVLTNISDSFTAPILIVQHMPARFTKSLAERLNTLSPIRVKEAEHGEIIENGTAYIAPGDFHMSINGIGTAHAISLSKDEPVKGHRPSVDTLFCSAAGLKRINKIAIVLTGMGNDGSAGIVEMKKQDPNTIVLAEAEETSIVYGMPKAAVQTGYVNQELLLNQFGSMLNKLTK
ncbi:chemotaxis response regulator protein-glutamate methylesterase [Oceanobacillus sp. FSL K6-2867]|uniref:protein-glutamate methylesterase/protein-glutamine glutaminase n=1 Tax=Oceanobacillus sp. FSL K6-2867 TaxID=2954748 RepID=UPI0030DAD6DA